MLGLSSADPQHRHEDVILGSASWGGHYGLSNKASPDSAEVKSMMNKAAASGIVRIDTAEGYGKSQKLIGDNSLTETLVYSKVGADIFTCGLDGAILRTREILTDLNTQILEGLSFHSSGTFLQDRASSIAFISKAKEEGLIKRWGVSIYSPEELIEILRVARPDYIQAPVNLADRRFISDQIFNILKANDIELHARSVFLQGLLLQPTRKIRPYFLRWEALLRNYLVVANDLGLDMYALSLAAVMRSEEVDKTVVGVNDVTQVQQLASLVSNLPDIPGIENFENSNDLGLIDPRLWRV